MAQENNILQQEMDTILMKTMDSVQNILQEQGETAARTLIGLIAEKIRVELIEGDVDENYARQIHDMYVHDMTQAIFSDKH